MFSVFDIRFMFVPFGVRHFQSEAGIGYTEYFIFGVRVAKIQRTLPW